MKRFAFKLFIAAAIYALFLGCGSKAKKENGEGDIPTKLTLYSIDFRESGMPDLGEPTYDLKSKNAGKERIGAWVVLGKIEIKDPKQRKEIMDSIHEAIRNPDPQAKCFWPRHLIRVEEAAGPSEITICFSCNGYEASGQLATEHTEAISDRPKDLLNKILADAKIEMVPEDH